MGIVTAPSGARDYGAFLARKRRKHQPAGFKPSALNHYLYPFQRHIVEWALRLGRAAIFADCGLGKTLMQLDWARAVNERTGLPVLILAPLAVSRQTEREGKHFGIHASVSRDGATAGGIVITNYEMLHHFSASNFGGVVLDESSILKSYSGKMRNQIIETFAGIPFKLACTATPSPNDYMELGNHAEFLGVMTRTAMLATFFNHDGGETSKWKLKGHAEGPFWEWMASWAVMLRKPSDLGYSDTGYDLPKLTRHIHTIETEAQTGYLFPVEAFDLSERRQSRRVSIDDRVSKCAAMVNSSKDQWVIWGDLNAETEAAADAIIGAVEVAGSHSDKHKEDSMLGFSDGGVRVLVSKPKIAGWGMNWQNCHNIVFLGLSDSFESMYQAERRCWRFGQQSAVDVHIYVSDRDAGVIRNIERKRLQAEEMAEQMMEAMKNHHGDR